MSKARKSSGGPLASSASLRSQSPPPPPPPPIAQSSSTSAPPMDQYTSRLASKVQQQAKELVDLEGELEDRKEYIGLCEQFVVTLDPSQPLPLDPNRLETLKARKAADHVNRSSRHTLTTISRQYEVCSKKVNEQNKTIEELELKLAENAKAREIAERRIASLQQKLSDQQSKLSIARRSTPGKQQKAEEDRAAMGEQLDALLKEKKRLEKLLAEESRASEEQRVYINVLQTALKAKAEELGLDPDQILNVEKAKFDVIASKGKVEHLEKTESQLRSKLEELEEKLRLETLRHTQTKQRLAWYEPEDINTSESTSVEENAAKNRRSSYSSSPSKQIGHLEEQSADQLKSLLHRLKQENDALVDYVRDTVEPLKAGKKELEEALESTADALDEAQREGESLRAQVSTMEKKLETLQLKLVEKDVEVNAAKEERDTKEHERVETENARHAIEEARRSLEQQLKEKQDQIQALEEQLETLREENQSTASLAKQLSDAQSALRFERHELVSLEQRRAALDSKTKELEDAVREVSEKLAVVSAERDQAQKQVRALESTLSEEQQSLRQAQVSIESLSKKLEHANEALAPLESLRQRLQQVEKTIGTFWTEGSTPERALENLNSILHKLSTVSMHDAVGSVSIDDEAELFSRTSVFNALENVLPNVNALLFSAKTQLSRSFTTQERLKQELQATEKRFDVEKRLLHDEIHSLRTKFDQVTQYKAERERLLEQADLSPVVEPMAAERNELAKLRQQYASLEAKYLLLEERQADTKRGRSRSSSFDDIHHHRENTSSARDFSHTALRNVQQRLDQATAQAEQIASLKQDLEKAARLLREHESVSKQLEEQLVDAEDQLHGLQYDVDLAKRLCVATVKGILVRYRTSHPAVQQFFVERNATTPGDSMEQTVTQLCELVEAILEHDTTVTATEMDRLAQSLESFRRDQLSLLDSMKKSRHRGVEHRRHRQPRVDSSVATHTRIEELNASLLRAQRVVDETKTKLERELDHHQQSRDMVVVDDEDAYSSLGDESSSEGGADVVASTSRRPLRRGAARKNQHTVRARSPAKVRVYRDGSIQVSTFEEDRDDDDERGIQATLRRAAERLDQIERIRKSSSRPETPLARRYRQQFRSAQEKLRRLNLDKY